MMAFSIKLRPVSSASSLMKRLCGSTSMCSPSMACSSLSLPALLLASTSWLNGNATLFIGVKLLLETQGMRRRTFFCLDSDLELQQPALASGVVGNEVHGLLFLHADELQWRGLLQRVLHRTFDACIHRLGALGAVALHGNVHHALSGSALQARRCGDVRLQK